MHKMNGYKLMYLMLWVIICSAINVLQKLFKLVHNVLLGSVILRGNLLITQ